MIPITRPYSLWNLKNYLEMTQSQPTSFPGFSPTRPTERERERSVARVGENPGNEVESQLRVKQKCLSCVKSNVKTTKMNFKNVRLTSFQKPQLQTVSIFFKFVHPPVLLFHLLSYLYLFSFFEWLFLCFTQFGDSSHCLNLDKFRDTAPFSFPTCTSFKTSLNDSSK